MKENITMSDVDLDMSGDVRSPAGHAAFSMRGTDDRWVKIQLNTFKNWLNDQLRDTDIFVEDLHGDLCDGIKLCILLEVLQGHKIGRIIKKPFNQHHYLENVNLALRAMTNDNIKLVNIGSEDIVNGNRKLTMALIWHLILRYQIGKSKVPAKKLMLSWIQAVLPDLGITNFSTDWNDGIALQALVEHCRPGTCPDWRNLSRKDGLNNCKEAMSLAKQHFGIPLVLSPENLSSPDLDELSGMTYLSYFMKVDSPGYDVTLNWVHEQIPQEDVQDFQTDWNDGSALTALVRKLGGDVPDMTSSNHEDIIETAMEAAQRLGVEPVISAKEMADPEVDHLGVMAYAAWFQHLSKLPERQPRVEEIIPVRSLPPPLPPSPPPEPPKPAVPPQDQLNVLWRRQDVYINRPVSVSLEVQDDDLDREDVKIEVIGPQGSQPQATVTWKDSHGRVEFTPEHVGPHKVVVYNKDTVVHGAPLAMEAKLDLSSVRLASSLNTPSYTGKATSLKINAKDAQRGAVKVEARAPSGRVHEMSVADANGVYTANFTPTEVGDWQVAIKYEGQHIQGSPFSVRVYDAAQVKVYGLEGGAVGKTFSFNVDTIGAGEGDLTINIVHNGRTIPANIIRDQNQPGKFRANFTPDGSGVYSIRVYFAGIEVTGSPYTLEIVDSSQVTAAGVGLTTVEINRKAEFLVNTGQSSGSGDLRVEVTGPHGSKIPATVRNNNDGTHTVEYVPSDVGEYVIDVYFYGRHIKGSPFKAQAFDWSRISVTNLRDTGMVGKTVEFDIDAASAGSGNLEIMVNDGTIPCSVQNRGNRQFHASFLPKEAKPHFIQMRFNGREVPGSPWRIEILSAANVSTSGKGLQLVPINTPSVFEVRTGNYSYSGNINVQITAPSGRVVPSNITSVGGGNFTAEYVPVEVGSYAINVSYEGMAVPGSPFTAKAYNADAIVVSSIPNGMINKPVDFTIDVTQAGEGQLEIMVNRGGVPNTVKMIRKGVFQVSFTPRDINPHTIDIKFNGELLRYSPITVPIMDTSRITVQGEGLRQVAVNRQSFFRVNTQRAGDADLAVRVTSPKGSPVAASVIGSGSSGFDVDFRPSEIGTYKVEMEYGGASVPGCPYYIKVYDPSKVKVREVGDGIVGVKTGFLVDIDDSGEGSLEISISGPSGTNLQNTVHQLGPGRFEVSYIPMENGPHKANILFNKQHVPGSPFSFTVIDASKVTATGEGLGLVPCNRATGFSVYAPGARPEDLNISIIGPDGRNVLARIYDGGRGSHNFTVEYTPVVAGEHKIEIRYFGQVVPGSPFVTKAWDASKVIVSDLATGRIGKPSQFYIDASRAGAGNLEIVVSCGGENVPNFVKAEGNARFLVSFTPNSIDTHTIQVKFNGESVPGSPFYHAIIDGSRATASGPGLKAVPANKPTYFDVFTQGVSGEAPLEVEITAPSGRNVPSRSSGTSQNGFRVEYVPIEVGPHKIQVHYADVDIQGSPFSVDVFDAGKVKVGDIPEGVLGQPVKFDIDTSSAGSGQLSVEVRGQSTSPHCDVTPRKAGRYEVIFVPREVAAHYVHVLFNGEKIPGSPFAANVFDWNNITVNWEAARVASVNKVVTLTLDPKGAPDAPVEAKVTDPYGQEVATQVNRHGSQYHILFTPVTVGPHTLVLLYGGQGLSGSPGTCNAYDASRVRLADVIQPGIINKEMGFTVDTSEAGFGDLDIEVFAKGGIPVNIHRSQLDQFRHRVTFVPGVASDHIAEVSFNYERIPGIPLVMNVFDWNNISVNWERARLVPVNKAVCVDLDPCGAPEAPVETRVIDPSGKELPTNVMRNGHIYQIMLTPTVIGPHTMTITYGGQVVQGSPFTLNAYDTARVRVHDVSTLGALRQEMGLTVDTTEAGMGDVEVEVKCQDRLLITKETAIGHHSRRHAFVPTVAEMHQVLVTFNKQQVPGSPFPMKVFDPNRLKVIWDAVRPVPLNRPATFTLDPCGAPPADVTCTVLDPNNRELVATVSRDATLYKATFTPMTLGAHKVTFTYGGQIVPGSPFICLTFDPNLVLVTDVTEQCILGQEVEFTVDVSTSGYKGEILVEVTCEGDTVPIRYFPLDFNRRKFTFSPLKAAIHEIDVCLNEVRPPGIPFSVRVIDFGQLVVDYEAARSVPLGSLGIIYIDPRGFPNPDVESRVTDSQGLDLPVVIQQEEGKYRVEFNPQLPDTYTVTLTFCGQPVPGSPHKCHVYDAEKVKVIDMKNNCSLGEEMSFWVDLGEVGEGELTLQVLARGENVPIRHQPLSKFRHQFMFVPQTTTNHEVHILFNKDKLPRSPYIVRVFDVKDVAMNFDAMRPVPVNKLVTMEIDARGLPESRVDVTVQDPLRNQIQPRVYNEGPVHKIEFTPVMVGVHTVSVQYGGQPVPGSPFLCNAYDTGRVIIQQVPSSVLVGQDTSFTVDVRDAGQGVLGAEVYHEGALVPFQHQRIDQVTHRFSVTPTEPGNHEVRLHFNGETVLGTPFNINAYNMNKMAVNTEAARLVAVNLPITVELDPRGVPDAKVEVRVTDTQGHEVPAQLTKNQNIFLVEFVPRAVGLYMMDLRCAGHPVPGSPFQCQAYDASRIQITDVTQQGMVREEMGFTVSTQGSGQGEVQAEVVFSGAQQQLTQRRLDQFRTRYSFVPTTPGDHLATVKFNKTIVPNTPFVLSVMDPSVRMYVRTDPAMQTIATGSTGASYVQSQGGARINIKDVTVRVIAPNGELVAAKILQQPDGDYKVEYSSRYTGRHTVEILYAGQAIMGSPFFVEIYDPNKIKVEGTRSGVVGQRMEIDILNNEAGRAELGLTINSPSGRNVPYDIAPTAVGERVSYVPIEAGPHQIYITYGGLEVPGTPITQAIVDAGTAGVYGDGIKFAHEDQPAQFYVDTQGRKGNLVVQVEGPNSISKVNVEPDPAGKFLVTYVPVEVGIYNVMVKWNGKPVEGSPFHPRVVDARKVRPIGGWEAILDSQERMHLKIAQRNRVEFDTTMAGPGEMRAEVKGPDGPVPAEVEGGNGKYAISFIPRVQGDYYIKVFWCEMCLPRCPVYAVAGPDAPIAPPVNHDKVVLSGHGLLEARVREEAEFVIDGNEAGPGTPEVRLSGVKSDIDVRLIPIGGNKYKAVYMPQIAGAYLLSIMWSDRQVRGSPYKVNVLPSSDASKVSVSGEGIRGGVFGKEIKAIIDTRRAGPGELTAHCMGPQKVAYCELYDHRDGTFTLNIKPQEAGKHLLQVKYGGEHVPGSPFILRVAGAPDASKVRVKGPGIEHGILADYQSRFICETRGAGAGQLTVRIRGPKGAFRVEMSRESQKDRTILCRYDPTEVGDYIISVKWSEEHVPGSPFHVQIFDTRNELERFLQNNPDRRKNAPALADEPWSDHF